MNINTTLFKNILYITHSSVRRYCQPLTGIKYYGFTYYPRNEDFKDPPFVPPKLFLIKRIKSMKGRNPIERQILAQLNIDGHIKDHAHISVVKNIPQTNALLWKVKHIVEIKPIFWKGDLPKDYLGTHLRGTGELVISPLLRVESKQLEENHDISTKRKKLDREYLKKYLHNKWWNGYSGTA